jgi:hypothetical protein
MKADSNIYVRVTTGQGLGDAFMIAVGTESSPDSATLMLHEVSPGVYRNTSADDSGLIRLGKEDALAPPSPHIHWFKTVDEELLTAKVRLVGTTTDICSKDVMVDRAEYGRAKGSPEDGDESTAWDTRLQNVKLAIDGNMNWADDGRAIGTTVASVQSAINDAVAGQCDFMFVLCHGGCGTDGSDYWYSMNYALYAPGQEPVGNSDEIRPADHWNQDVEWVWFDACEVLGVPPDEVDEIEDNDPNNDPDPWIGLHVWDDVLLNSPRQMHALMGYSWKVRTSGSEAIDDFFEALADGETVKQAYIDANVNYNIQGYDAPYVIIINQDNVADTGETITRDSTDPEVCVSWGDVDYLITVDEEEMAAYDPRPTVKSSESSPFGQGFPGRLYSGGGARLVLGDDALRTNRTHSIRSTDRASVLFRTDRPNQLSQLGRHQREAIEAESRRVFSELTGSTLPASAKCCSIMTMHEMTGVNPKDRANAKSRTVGRVVRFRNYIEGIPVEGDFIRIQTGESQTTTLAAKWHDVGNLRSLKPDDCVSATNAIADVTVHTGQQGPPKDLRYSRLVYMVNAEDELIPTWKFILKGQKVLTTPACRGPVK